MTSLAYRHPNDPYADCPEPRHIGQDELDFEIALHLERVPGLFPEEYASGSEQERKCLQMHVVEALRHVTPANLAAIGAAYLDCVRASMNDDAEATIRGQE